jgi:PTH1 family peptidyl-tRNA hydrolase
MVVGLGNPGSDYKRSRHNIGFEVLDELASRRGVRFRRKWRSQALVGRTRLGGEDLLLVKPQTYMNRSGRAVRLLLGKHGLGLERLMVVVDDADLEPGRLRIRKKGGAGHHNGLKSLLAELGASEFVRLRVGVGGKPDGGDMVEHVLAPVTSEERPVFEKAVDTAATAVEAILMDGVDQAMNRFNPGM